MSILDALPEQAVDTVDDHGYALLAKHGYNVDGVRTSKKKRQKLRSAMRKRGEVLECSTIPGKEKNSIILFFSLVSADGTVIDRSRGVKMIFKD